MSKCIGTGLLFGHKFEARYSLGLAMDMNTKGTSISEVIRLLDSSRARTYEGDVCTRCGMVVNKNDIQP